MLRTYPRKNTGTKDCNRDRWHREEISGRLICLVDLAC